jgi:hypothetical protein
MNASGIAERLRYLIGKIILAFYKKHLGGNRCGAVPFDPGANFQVERLFISRDRDLDSLPAIG